jgi:hypothetical protein
MLRIDWGDLRPTSAERSALEARLATVDADPDSKVYVSRHGSGFEARLRVPVEDHSAEVRLHDVAVDAAVERLVELLEIVAQERRSGLPH